MQTRLAQSRLELEQARHFIRWITNEDLFPVEKPDCTRPSTRKHPDYRFQDCRGQEYVLELTRLLTPKLRELEDAAAKKICTPVANFLPGTYTLHIRLTDPLGRGRIAPRIAERTVEEILRLIEDGSLQEIQHLSTGFVLAKVRDDGHMLVPWVTVPELPFDLTDDHPIANELRSAFEDLVLEADHKFRDYGGFRLLLINTSQSGLDLEFHAQRFKDSEGVLLTWVENLSQVFTNIDFIYLERGISVWQAGDMHRVLAGHRYVESKAGCYVELWHCPGTPRVVI